MAKLHAPVEGLYGVPTVDRSKERRKMARERHGIIGMALVACFTTTALVGVIPASGQPSPVRTAAAVGGTCAGRAVTIAGTPGNDILRGTDGPDVIDAGDGNDTVRGGNGDDVICGGNGADNLLGENGNDTVLGGSDNDALIGGNGNDVLIGSLGNDSIVGGNGDDTLVGGEGNDAVVGGNGNDRVGGGPGDDALLGDRGDDFVNGGTGQDGGKGGAGNDSCALLEFSAECERSVPGDPDPGLGVTITSPLPETMVSGTMPLTVSATSSVGIQAVEIFVAGRLVASDTVQGGPGTVSRTLPVDYSILANGTYLVTAIVTDVYGDTSLSAPVPVVVANELRPEGPSTGLILQTPVSLTDLEGPLVASGLKVIEFFHERPATQAPPIPDALAGLLNVEGLSVVQPIS